MAKRVLAAVVLAKDRLRIGDLVELLSTGASSDANDVLASIEPTLRKFSVIIPISDDANDELRVSHKTFSDFLLSQDRSLAALKSVVHGWTPRMPGDPVLDPHPFILDTERENRSLAHACIRLVCRIFRWISTSLPSFSSNRTAHSVTLTSIGLGILKVQEATGNRY